MPTVPDQELRSLAAALSGGSVTADSPGLDEQLAAAARWVRQYCGWHIWPERSDHLVIDGSGVRNLQLPSMYVTAVESVSEVPDWHSGDLDDEPVALVERRDFTWSRSGLLRKRHGCWTREFRGVTVELTHGYPAAEVSDLLSVVAKAAVRGVGLAAGEIARVGGISFQSTPGAAAAGGSAFLGPEYAVLDHYRLNAEL